MASKNFNMSFDPDLKQQFSEVVAGYGLTAPQAFKLFANQVIHTGVLPLSFDWQAKIPNEETKRAIREGREDYYAGKLTGYSTEEATQKLTEIAHG